MRTVWRELAADFLTGLIENEAKRQAFFAPLGEMASVDLTDGLRVDFDGGAVVHLRPSGNAPEFRLYAQSCSEAKTLALVARAKELVAGVLSR